MIIKQNNMETEIILHAAAQVMRAAKPAPPAPIKDVR